MCLNVEINVLAEQGQSSDSVLKIMDLYKGSKEIRHSYDFI